MFVAAATARQTSVVGKPEASLSAWAKRQSPSNTEISLPQLAASVGRPRRILASSITSSCTSVARWTISIITATITCESLGWPVALALNATNAGRNCLPCPVSAYSA